jgi:capsular polysaccharide biosynthesis protein
MNRKIMLFILLLSFSFSSGLFALEVKSSPYSTEIEVLVENENSEKEKEEYFFETLFVYNEHFKVSILSSQSFLYDFTLAKSLFRPPIV